MSESEIRASFQQAGYKLCRLANSNCYRVYLLKEREFFGSYNTFYTLAELAEIAERGNYLQFFGNHLRG